VFLKVVNLSVFILQNNGLHKFQVFRSKLLIHSANKYTFDTYKYSLMLLLHVSVLFTSPSGRFTPQFKPH